MATIVTRDTGASAVSRPLTVSELDNNFINLNTAISAINIPKITSIAVTDSSYVVLDDTAVSTSGGYIKITGTGFTSGSQVLIGTIAASSVSFVSSTELRAQVPATAAGTYVVYVVATDGSVAIRVNGITFSATPTWTTSSTLGTSGITINIQLAAVSDTTITYSLAAGSTLPTGLSLSNSGLLSGTVTEPTVDTTYNFTINAVDLENQDSPRTFSITITVKDPYFPYVSLLLNTGSTNGQQNNTFLDSSTNNFTITRNGTPTQGSITPYWPNGQWSNYFVAVNTIYNASISSMNFGASTNFTIEAWVNWPAAAGATQTFFELTGTTRMIFGRTTTGFRAYWNGTEKGSAYTFALGTWYHIAVVRNSGTVSFYINGSLLTSFADTVTWTGITRLNIGSNSNDFEPMTGYVSNLRVVNGTAVYTSAFTPPTSPLTAITNTQLLTCQSNRFQDNSTNNYTFSFVGTPTVQAFQPFSPTASYTTALYGGSGYFNGSPDYLSSPVSTSFALGTSNFTVEMWVYLITASGGKVAASFGNFATYDPLIGYLSAGSTSFEIRLSSTGSSWNISDGSVLASTLNLNSWNHVALVRNGSNIALYVNGALINSVTSSASIYQSANYAFIGKGQAAFYFPGYIANYRFVNGTAVYTAAFTPPTAPVTAITNTSLLLNFTNAAIYDASVKHNIITVSNTQTNNTIYKWPLSSIFFNGGTSSLSIPSSTAFGMGTGDWTIEFWIYLNALPSANVSLVSMLTNTSGVGFAPHIYYATGSGIRYYTNSADRINGGALATATWNYIAVNKTSGITKMYINGTQTGSNYTDTNDYGSSNPLAVADYAVPLTGSTINGYIQDLRITRGVARTITTPTLAFQTR